jgi:hypothetical protein
LDVDNREKITEIIKEVEKVSKIPKKKSKIWTWKCIWYFV